MTSSLIAATVALVKKQSKLSMQYKAAGVEEPTWQDLPWGGSCSGAVHPV